jgi:hypothetical protein
LLFNYSVRKKQFVLLGGIGKSRTKRTNRLYIYLLPNADKIVVRDKDSYAIAREIGTKGQQEKELNNNVVLYQDFAQEILLKYEQEIPKINEQGSPYILININKQSVDKENIQKIIDFCAYYPDHAKIFFPCDMNNDIHCFPIIKKYIPDLKMYDRTRRSLSKSLSLFYHADGGV